MSADTAASGGSTGRSAASPLQAGLQSGMRGMFLGLVLGTIWGVWEEKKFVLRNCVKEYHLRECPTRLFTVMHRSVTTAPVVATFLGVNASLRCWWHNRQAAAQTAGATLGAATLTLPIAVQQQPQEHPRAQQKPEAQQEAHHHQHPEFDIVHPVMAGAAGTAAGAVRAVLSEAAAAVRPLMHAQRVAGAGAASAGLFALGGLLEQEQRRLDAAAERQRAWEAEHWGEASPSSQAPGSS